MVEGDCNKVIARVALSSVLCCGVCAKVTMRWTERGHFVPPGMGEMQLK